MPASLDSRRVAGIANGMLSGGLHVPGVPGKYFQLQTEVGRHSGMYYSPCVPTCPSIPSAKGKFMTPAKLLWAYSLWFAFLCLCPLPIAGAQSPGQAPPAEFGRLVAQLSPQGADESPQSQAAEEQALAILDRAALEALNLAAPDLDALNRRLSQFVTHRPPSGEGYSVVRLSGNAPVYALAANFGLGGPSAVRVYAGTTGKLALAGRVDRYEQPDYLDDYIELVPWKGSAALFVTVAGRSDELQTGIFAAWLFDGRGVKNPWTSDILQQSSYEMSADGFRLTYCSEPDQDDLNICKGMQRDRYLLQDGAWKRVESTPLPAPASKR
jgi:hypothetical protein